MNLLEEALRAEAKIESLYLSPEGASEKHDDHLESLVEQAMRNGTRVFELESGVLEKIADTVTPQPVLAVVHSVDVGMDELEGTRPTFLVVCVDLRDPGNAGVVVRSAAAAGAQGIICCGSSVDLFNPKALRASAGAIFHLPVVASGDTTEVLSRIGSWGLRRLGAVAREGVDHTKADLSQPMAVLVGNEAHGLDLESVSSLVDEKITVQMAATTESLNVATAAAVICFEARRQRTFDGQ